ncbi:MAG: OmpA family protein [Gammaproteobacteria bacterium]|nr:OmpA family protein [Gammaproteobacteria bacterium]
MKKTLAVAAALTFSLSAEAAYRDNGGVAWPTLFGQAKTECEHRHAEAKAPAAAPAAEAAPQETKKLVTFDSITFAYKSTSVSGSQTDLNAAKAAIQADSKATYQVVGHTDSSGPEAYNQTLSEQRAQAVLAWLVANGVDANRLTAVGKGESSPVADNSTAEGRAQNRRVELHRAN